MARRAWNHNIHYHPLVLNAIPLGCRRALDVGCGQGLLTQRLAERCHEVIGIDTDHKTLMSARTRNERQARIHFVEGDVMSYPFSADHFDVITVVATLHHLPLRPALTRFKNLLRSGG